LVLALSAEFIYSYILTYSSASHWSIKHQKSTEALQICFHA